jgi:hypothetical protein
MKTFNVFKGLAILGLLYFILALNVQAQDIRSYSNNWGPNGMTLTRQSLSNVEVNFSVHKLYLEDVVVDNTVLKAAKMEGIFLPNDAGKPDLAGTGRLIAVPQGATANFRIISYKSEILKNVDIAPAPILPKDNDKSPLKYFKDNSVYSKNANYPESPVQLSNPMKIRGVDAVMLGITPFLYNPVTKELTVYTDLKVEVSFVGGNGHFGDDAYRNRWWEPLLSDHLLNYSSLPVIDFDHRYKDIMNRDGYEYVIIVPNNPEFSQWADSIKNFRTMQGIKTGVYKLSEIGGNNIETIKSWVANAYTNWSVKPIAMCLLADYGTDASGASTIISKLQPDTGYPDFASDNYYSDVNNDEMPEIVFSRIIANNATELQTLITKNLNYERNPPTSAYFYSHPITALGWQTERWFQICSEVLGGFFKKSLGKTPVRINKVYAGTPGTVWSTATNTATVISYFGPQGRYYIPQTPDSLGGFDGGTPTQVVTAINTGAFLLQHRDHGEYIGWGEPGFNTSYIPSLTNTDLTFIYSINCETGAYHNPSGCPANGSFVEVFYRYKYNNANSGALGMVCPSEVSYSFVNDTYCWGMYDNMWPNFMPDYGNTNIQQRDLKPAFGMASGKYFLQQSSWPYNTGDKLVTYRLFHMHGDAFLNLYSEVPQNLTVNHAAAVIAGATQFAVTANAGSFIALSINGNILGTGTGTGSPVNITIPGTQVPGQTMNVVITKQNYYRYQGTVNVIPASGPYVVQDSVAINDPLPNGNNNHLMDYGEVNQLTLRVKNVGSVTANNVNVKVTTTNPYITMTDSTESYGNITAGSTATVNNAFAYNVSNLLPDNTLVTFNVVATSGTDTWTSSFSLTGHASKIAMGTNIITDSAGNNNGRLDPGETAKFKIAIRNSGSSGAKNVSAKLTTTSSYITLIQDSVVYGDIASSDSVRKAFQLSAAVGTPVGTVANFRLKMYNIGGLVTAIDSFQVTVGQNWIFIGNGSTETEYPYYTYYHDSRAQMIYSKSEIIASGGYGNLITGLSLNVTSIGGQPMTNFRVRMKNTLDSTLSAFDNTTSGWVVVYTNASYIPPTTGWQGFTLTTPFPYSVAKNLMIEICFDNTSWTTSTKVYSSSTVGQRTFHMYMDNGAGCTSATLTYTTTSPLRPNVKLVFDMATGVNNIYTGIPKKYDLKQNYPNPFNPVTKINYELPKDGFVTIKIYDVLGREVKTLVNEVKPAGYYSIDFEASTLSSGVYFYKMESGTFSSIKRMMLIK